MQSSTWCARTACPVGYCLTIFARRLPALINLHTSLGAVWTDVHTLIPAIPPLCFIAQRILAIPASFILSGRSVACAAHLAIPRSGLSNPSEIAELMLCIAPRCAVTAFSCCYEDNLSQSVERNCLNYCFFQSVGGKHGGGDSGYWY
jgi:hypothetical protein